MSNPSRPLRTTGARRPSAARAAGLVAAVLLSVASATASAQAYTENFDNITTLVPSGWFIQNNSTPLGGNTWFQGTPTTATPTPGPFNAWNGAVNSYIGVNFNSTSGGTGTISNWLGTPNRTLRNGDVFQFYTRKPTIGAGQTDYPDRLEVRMSTNGASTNVGSGGGGLGDFTTLLMSVNPTLVAGGYPQVWTQYTVTISGLPAPTSGRIAYRYFVTGAGPTGANSDYIGIDNTVYTPYVCPALTLNPTTLGGGSYQQAYNQSLSQTGALGAPNYAVTAGALPPGLTISASGTIAGFPTATGTFNFTVTVADNSGCSGSRPYSITIVPVAPSAPLNVTAVAGDAQVEVSWLGPGSDGGDPSLAYNVSCVGGNTVNGSGNPPITLTGLVNGTAYTCAVTASNSAGPGPAGTSNTVTPKGNQTITFDTQAGQTYSPGGTFAINPLASATSGLDVTYGSSTPTVCTVGGTTVSIVSAGTCTITADQTGNGAWNPAPQAQQPLEIAQASQTLTFPPQTEASRWLHVGATFAIAPLATSANPNSGEAITYSSLSASVCSVSGTTVTMLSDGSCTISANQAGNTNYSAAPQAIVGVDLVPPTEADLRVQMGVDNDRPAIGDTITYTIVVANDGEGDTTDVHLQDTPPDRLDPASVAWACTAAVGATCPSPGTGALDVVIASMPKNATLTFTLSGDVDPAADPANDYDEFFNTATVALSGSSGLTDPPGNNSSTVGVRVDDTLFKNGFELTVP